MPSEIKINNPSEIILHIKRINAILALYQENCKTEFNEIAIFENFISEAKQTVSSRRHGKQIALEQTRKSESESEAASSASRELQVQIDKCDEHLRNINQCQNDYFSLRQDQSLIVNECTELSDISKTLSSKIELLITKIIEAK